MAGKTEYKNSWQSEHRDKILLLVEKGKKEKIKTHAENLGMSLNAYINALIDKDIPAGD